MPAHRLKLRIQLMLGLRMVVDNAASQYQAQLEQVDTSDARARC